MSCHRAAASSSVPNPFCGASLPAARTIGRGFLPLRVTAGTTGAATTARPMRRAPAARMRCSVSGDTHSTESALRATIRSRTR